MSTNGAGTDVGVESQRWAARLGPYIRDERNPSRFLVNRETMTSRGIWEEEREKVFGRAWLLVGHASEVPKPNDFRSRNVGGRSVILCRDPGGAVRVWFNTCTHRGAEVCRDRTGNGTLFRCFYHGWAFDTAGRLAVVPDEQSYGDGLDKVALGLVGPRVETYKGFVFMNLDRAAGPLEDFLAGAKYYVDLLCDQGGDGMEFVAGTHEYAIRANWKLLVENSADGYHAMPVHKTYFDYARSRGDVVPSAAAKVFVDAHAYELGSGHAVTVKSGPWARPVARWTPTMGDEGKPVIEAKRRELEERLGPDRAHEVADLDYNMLLFPNLVINDIMANVVRTFFPVAPDRMLVTAWSIAPVGEDELARSLRSDAFLSFLGPGGLATPDDVEALESCQRGFSNTADVGWSDVSRGLDKPQPTNADELQQRSFWREWNRMMLDA